jgi:hypothetical protein
MFQRFATRLMLLCYSVIALGGQGLHLLQHGHAHDDGDEHPPALVAAADGMPQVVDTHSHEDGEHDSEHCAVCQHHALGQLFITTPPVETVLGVCELLSTPAPETVICPTLFSPAQPRAPPSSV